MAATATNLCQNCVQGYRLPGTPAGETISVGPLQAYFHASPRTLSSRSGTAGGSTTEGKSAVVIFTDAFGLPMNNPQIMADMFSRKMGVDVYVPDLFEGRPPINETRLAPYIPDKPGVVQSIKDKLSYFWVILSSLPTIFSNRPDVLNTRAKAFLSTLKTEKRYSKIGVIGYCLGGSTAVHVATTDLINSAVIAHPAPFGLNDVKAFKVPSSWVCAEEDQFFPTAFRNECEAALRAHPNPLPTEFREYAGTVHGFACRPNLAMPEIKQAFIDALEQSTGWFEKTLDVNSQ